MIKTIADFVPRGAESGVGLALQDEQGRYIFFLAGTRHHCPPGEIFYAGIGGHRGAGESWLACAYREAGEEIGAQVEIIPSAVTWLLRAHEKIRKVKIKDKPTPFALYEMVHPPNTPRAGMLYRIVIYRALLRGQPTSLQKGEVEAVIALTAEQVLAGLEEKPTLRSLLKNGGQLIAGGENLPGHTRLYPLGTARALAEIFRLTHPALKELPNATP